MWRRATASFEAMLSFRILASKCVHHEEHEEHEGKPDKFEKAL